MKINSRSVSKSLQVLAGAAIVTSALAVSRAQETPVSETTPPIATADRTTEQVASFLDDNALRAEKSLQRAVTFEAKRQPLPEVLAALQKQSGVTLSVTPSSPLAVKLLTARAKDLPLASVMETLSQLYGAAWDKKGAGFELKSNGRNLLDNEMWKMDATSYNAALNAIDNPIDWRDEIANLGVQQLQQKNGVPFEEVSPEIAQQLRAQLEPQDVVKLGLALDNARLSKLEDSQVQITNESSPGTARLLLTFLTANGARAGEELVVVKPTDSKPDTK